MPILYRLPIPSLQHAFAIFDLLRAIGNISIGNTRASSGITVFSKMADPGEKLQHSEDSISQEACNLAVAGTGATAIALTYLV